MASADREPSDEVVERVGEQDQVPDRPVLGLRLRLMRVAPVEELLEHEHRDQSVGEADVDPEVVPEFVDRRREQVEERTPEQ